MPEKIVQITDKKISRLINIFLLIDFNVFSYFINRINIWLVRVQIKTK